MRCQKFGQDLNDLDTSNEYEELNPSSQFNHGIEQNLVSPSEKKDAKSAGKSQFSPSRNKEITPRVDQEDSSSDYSSSSRKSSSRHSPSDLMSNGSSIEKDNNDDSDNSQDDYFIRVQQNSGVKDTNQQAEFSINLSSDF